MGSKEVYLCKKWLFYPLLACLACKWLQLGTAVLLIITTTEDDLFTNVNNNDLK